MIANPAEPTPESVRYRLKCFGTRLAAKGALTNLPEAAHLLDISSQLGCVFGVLAVIPGELLWARSTEGRHREAGGSQGRQGFHGVRMIRPFLEGVLIGRGGRVGLAGCEEDCSCKLA
jgi:hypothetical protein